MNSVHIGDREIGPDHPCFIIAEVGVNHNGDPDIARRMIDEIAAAGADCVKFQTFSAEEFVNSPDETYEYVSQGKVVRESMLAMFKRLEIAREEFAWLFAHARAKGLIPLSTPTDRHAVDLLDALGAPAFKIGSDDLVYTPFLRYAAGKGKPLILSTGMADAADIERAVDLIGETECRLILLHCVSLYPTPERQVNLRKISTLRALYDLPIGFSDHSQGVTACLGAVALGACVLEKHFTLDRNMAGPDHWFSADPEELGALVREVRRLEQNLGRGRLTPSPAEKEMAALCRRSIVAAVDIPAGKRIADEDLAFRRPGTGILPYRLAEVTGKRALVSIARGTLLRPGQLED